MGIFTSLHISNPIKCSQDISPIYKRYNNTKIKLLFCQITQLIVRLSLPCLTEKKERTHKAREYFQLNKILEKVLPYHIVQTLECQMPKHVYRLSIAKQEDVQEEI